MSSHPRLPAPFSRRQFLMMAAATSSVGSLHAKTPAATADNPLKTALSAGLGSDIQVARLWLLIAQQAQRAAVLSRCAIGRRPLTELEWDPQFQASLTQDCRQLHTIPLFQRIFVQTWLKAADQTWAKLSSKEQAQWAQWLASSNAPLALNSMRAEDILEQWSAPDWNIDARTGAPTAIPVVLAVQGLRQAGVLQLVIQATSQANTSVGQQLSKVSTVSQTKTADTKALLALSSNIAEHAGAIDKNYMALADKKWPERVSWGNGPLADHPLQCDFVWRAEIARIAGADAMKFRPADYAPVTLSKLCS